MDFFIYLFFPVTFDISKCLITLFSSRIHAWIVIFNPYFNLSRIATMRTENIYMKTSLLWVCFLLNYFLEKGYPRVIEMNTDKGQSSYS